jgi:predicted transcriptional regulator
MARRPYRYLCPTCGAWYWSVQYRKSILHDCLICFQRGRHYREGLPEARQAQRQIDAALAATYAEPRP